MKKKALAIFNTSKTIYDFVWYYATYEDNYEWTALCCPYGEYNVTKNFCENMGVFKKIISSEQRFDQNSLFEKINEFMKMFIFFILGKRDQYCKNLINNVIDIEDYDLILVPPGYRLLFGAIIAMGKRKKIIIFEDGTADYLYMGIKNMKGRWFDLNEWAGFFIAKMGYGNPMFRYLLKTTCYCDKYCTFPEKINKHLYKNVYEMRNMENTNMTLYNDLLVRTFNLTDDSFNADICLFTAPLDVFSDNKEDYEILVNQTINYINETYEGKKIILKKHPRDIGLFKFSNNINLKEIQREVPGEIFLDKLDVKEAIFMYPSTLIGDIKISNIKIIHYDKLSNNETEHVESEYEHTFWECIEMLGISSSSIIELGN